MIRSLTGAMKAVLGFELLIAALFALWGWGETYANARGRAPSGEDMAALSLPLLLVVAAAFAAGAAVRSGRGGLAWAVILLPFPVALFLYGFMGALV